MKRQFDDTRNAGFRDGFASVADRRFVCAGGSRSSWVVGVSFGFSRQPSDSRAVLVTTIPNRVRRLVLNHTRSIFMKGFLLLWVLIVVYLLCLGIAFGL